MKQLRLVLSPLALVALTWVSQSSACDKDHNASAAAVGASAKSHACSAQIMSACEGKGAAATAAAVHCPGMLGVALNLDASAAEGRADCCLGKSASAASAEGYDHCAGKGASATSASNRMKMDAGQCSAHASKAAMMAADGGQCSAHASKAAMMTAEAGQCSGHLSPSASARLMHADCDACADMADCEAELQGSGARVQMVPLKNGVMFVYTASSPGKVSALQSSLARRTERLNQIVSAGEKAHLCAECKQMRGAMASGKLNREVVNIEGGALTLMTSNDPRLVSKLYSMLDLNSRMARKS